MNEHRLEKALEEIAEFLQRIECEMRHPKQVEITVRVVLEGPPVKAHYHPTVAGSIRVQ